MPPVISRTTQSLRTWWSKKPPLEKRVLFRCTIAGVAITLAVVMLDMAGTLEPMEQWLYDRRCADCQYFNKPPTDQLVHIDIDDRSLDVIGRWPWPRSRMAELLDEIAVGKPKAVMLDALYSEPEPPTYVPKPDGSFAKFDGDADLAASIQRLGNVVLPISLYLSPPRSVSDVRDALVAELTANLELTPDEVKPRLRTRGFATKDVEDRVNADFLRCRREAMATLINWLLDEPKPPADFSEVSRRLLPHTDTTIKYPIVRVLGEVFENTTAQREARRFGIAPTKRLPAPLHTAANLVPIPQFTQAGRAGGFADHELFAEPVVRALPLLVEQDGRIFPQFGFALACSMLDADLANAHVDGRRLVIPTATGRPIVVPVRSYASKTLRRDVPLIVDIPFFGTRNWETMYDYPRHAEPTRHISMNLVWEICDTRHKIVTNNQNIDTAISVLLEGDDPHKLMLEPDAGERYRAHPPALDDTAARQAAIDFALKKLKDSGLMEMLGNVKPEDLDEKSRGQRDDMIAAQHTLAEVPRLNVDLVAQLKRLRGQLSQAVAGRGVLIGSIATGAKDDVTTSLHARCPGVVVHGVIANAVLTGQWWTRAPTYVAGLFAIGLGLLVALAVGWFSAPKAAMVASFVGMAYLVVNGIVLFDYGNWVVGAAGPLVAVAATWAGCSIVRQVTELIERVRVARDLAVFRREMELAKKVQVALIPKTPPKIRGIESHGWTLPADITGGDCFDLWKLSDGRLGILLADASGHGLAPSMIVSQVRTLVRAMADLEPHPHGLLARVNARLADDLEAGRFVTAFAGYLDSEGNLTWASAGHGPVLWCQGNGNKKMVELESSALPLGIQPDWLADDPAPPLKLAPGGLLIVMSDGIFEAPAPGGEQFGVDRCLKIFEDKCDASSVEIVAALRDAVRTWQAKDIPVDDQTTVVVRRVDDGVSVTVATTGHKE